jgi:hypothetical protein
MWGIDMKALNSAGRLLEILQELKELRSNRIMLPSNQPLSIKDGWVEIFNLEEKDGYEIHYKMGEVMELINKVRNEIKALNNEDEEEFLSPINNIAEIFSKVNLESQINVILDDANFKEALVGLKYCALTLKGERKESQIDNEELEQILVEVGQLCESVLNTELPKQLKIIILNNLENIRKSIIDLKIQGIEGIKKAMEASVGSLILNNETVKESKEGVSIVEKILLIIGKLDQVVRYGKKTKELVAPIIKYYIGN